MYAQLNHDAPRPTHRPGWNHNVQYERWLLDAVAPLHGRVLDVGCGDGQLCRRLARRGARLLVGIDRHGPSVDLARQLGGGAAYIHGDFFRLELRPGSWDAIVSVAALHHMDLRAALKRVRRLLRPGGTFAALGLAQSGLTDLPWDAAGHLLSPLMGRGRLRADPASPQLGPPHTYGEVRRLARRILPGVRYRRHVLHRYSLRWIKPN